MNASKAEKRSWHEEPEAQRNVRARSSNFPAFPGEGTPDMETALSDNDRPQRLKSEDTEAPGVPEIRNADLTEMKNGVKAAITRLHTIGLERLEADDTSDILTNAQALVEHAQNLQALERVLAMIVKNDASHPNGL